MAKQKDFDAFISEIEPKKTTVDYVSSIQSNLRDYLRTHSTYSKIHKETFLSGSYAKHTCIRPSASDKKRDVDIIVVTKHEKTDDSKEVIQELCDALLSSQKYDSAKVQHHSVGIEMGQVSVDVVPVIEDAMDSELYYIGDSESGGWTLTDPKGHIQWSTEINQSNNSEYKPLVKIIKWWRKTNCPDGKKYPKGIALEKIIADNMGDSSASTESFLIETMDNIISAYKEQYSDQGIVPIILDPSSKNQTNNLLEGYTSTDFKAFIDKISEHSDLLNDEGTTNDTWRKILGNEFPKDTVKKFAQNELICASASHRKQITWPFSRGSAVMISLKAVDKLGNVIPYESNGEPLEKDIDLHFKALTGAKPPYTVKWQVTNTGAEAMRANCLRGDFYNSDDGINGRKETTSYTGSHSVQCFIIKRGICIAKSRDYIINIR